VALVLSRQNLPTLDRSRLAPAAELVHGAYILADVKRGNPDLILIATGSELSLAIAAGEELQAENIRARVVSMPSWELFDEQPQEYRDFVIPPQVKKRLVVEAGSPQGWHRYAGDGGSIIGVEQFGASAPGEVMLREYGFTVENIHRQALALLTRRKEWE
jgi:transketolase